MKEYIVHHTNGESETYYNLAAAKKAMKSDQGSTGVIYKTWANGDFECLGNISLASHNRTFVANTRQRIANYN